MNIKNIASYLFPAKRGVQMPSTASESCCVTNPNDLSENRANHMARQRLNAYAVVRECMDGYRAGIIFPESGHFCRLVQEGAATRLEAIVRLDHAIKESRAIDIFRDGDCDE